MATLLTSTQRSLLATATVALLSMQIPSCAGDDASPSHHTDVVTSDGGTPTASSSVRGGSTSVGGAFDHSVGDPSSDRTPFSGGAGGADATSRTSPGTAGGAPASEGTMGSVTAGGARAVTSGTS